MKKLNFSFMLSSFLISLFYVSLFFASDAFSQAVAQNAPATQGMAQPSFIEAMMRMLPLCIIIYFIFYFLVTRPQEQANKKKKEMLDKLCVNDIVKTSCGMFGRVVSADKETVTIDIAQGVKVKFSKDAIVLKL